VLTGAARRRTHTRKCASQRATRTPVGSTSPPCVRPEGGPHGRATPKGRRGFRSPGKPWSRLRPDRHRFHRGTDGTEIPALTRRSVRRRGCVGYAAKDRVNPPRGWAPLPGTEVPSSVMHRSASRAPPVRTGGASLATGRKRPVGARTGRTGSGQWIRTCRCSRQRTFPKKRSPR